MSLQQENYLANSFAGKVTRKPVDTPEIIVDRVLGFLPEAKNAGELSKQDPLLLLAVAAQESHGKPDVFASAHGAHGLMQIEESTWNGIVNTYEGVDQYSNYSKFWNNPQASLDIGGLALYDKGDLVHAPKSDPNFVGLQITAYNAGQKTVNAAIDAAKAAGEKNPYSAALSPVYLKAGIESAGIYSFYMPGHAGAIRNDYVDDDGSKLGTDAQIKADAIRLKYEEVSNYSNRVLDWYKLIQNKVQKNGRN